MRCSLVWGLSRPQHHQSTRKETSEYGWVKD